MYKKREKDGGRPILREFEEYHRISHNTISNRHSTMMEKRKKVHPLKIHLKTSNSNFMKNKIPMINI